MEVRDGRGESRKEGDEEARFADDGHRVRGVHRGGARRDEGPRQRAEAEGRADQGGPGGRGPREDRRDVGADRALAERLHAVIKANAPVLTSKLWYGMPAYARDGKVVCFFQSAAKFKTRYAMLGFSDEAHLDDGTMWPAYYALTTLTADDEARIAALMRQAVS